MPHLPGDEARFVRRAAWVLLLVAGAALVVALADMLLLVFAAVLVAIVFDALARALSNWWGLPHRWALLLAVLAVLAALALGIAFFGAQLRLQVLQLQETLPRAWRVVEAWLDSLEIGAPLLDALRDWSSSSGALVQRLGNAATSTLAALGALVLVVVAGVYLAVQPRTYRGGLLELMPQRSRERARETMHAIASALRAWMQAQLAAMAVVTVLTTLGLWAIGVPSALALGLLAGLAEIVPVVGPLVAAIPALLLATTLGVDTVLWTLGLYVAIQQIEGNVIFPLVTRRAVALPPALALFAVFALGTLLGPMGVLLGAPLAVVAFVLVRELVLERPVEVK